MKLIIAEKPSLARTIAKALGKYKSHTEEDRTGYLENDDYIITWAFGHLYTLKDVNDYLGKKLYGRIFQFLLYQVLLSIK